jgi:hypothetical protein
VLEDVDDAEEVFAICVAGDDDDEEERMEDPILAGTENIKCPRASCNNLTNYQAHQPHDALH